MDTEKIKERNLSYLQEFLERYGLGGRTLDDFDMYDSGEPYKITSIYINFYKDHSFRLYGNERRIVEKEDGTGSKIKFKKVMLYNFSVRKMKGMTQEDIYKVKADFARFVLMYNEIRHMYDIEKLEWQIESVEEFVKFPNIKSLS